MKFPISKKSKQRLAAFFDRYKEIIEHPICLRGITAPAPVLLVLKSFAASINSDALNEVSLPVYDKHELASLISVVRQFELKKENDLTSVFHLISSLMKEPCLAFIKPNLERLKNEYENCFETDIGNSTLDGINISHDEVEIWQIFVYGRILHTNEKRYVEYSAIEASNLFPSFYARFIRVLIKKLYVLRELRNLLEETGLITDKAASKIT